MQAIGALPEALANARALQQFGRAFEVYTLKVRGVEWGSPRAGAYFGRGGPARFRRVASGPRPKQGMSGDTPVSLGLGVAGRVMAAAATLAMLLSGRCRCWATSNSTSTMGQGLGAQKCTRAGIGQHLALQHTDW